MKQCIYIFIMFLLSYSANAQSYAANRYYGEQYYVEDVPVGYSYPVYDAYGYYCGTYQKWKRAEWHSAYGGHSIYVWNGYSWVSQWANGYYYWFTWAFYEKYIGY